MDQGHTVYVISSPRSRSVCTLRALEQTGLFNIFHEPYCPIFQARKYPKETGTWSNGKQFISHEQIQETLALARTSLNKPYILVKDMSFAMYEDFMKNPTSFTSGTHGKSFIFLLREPYQVLRSVNRCTPILHNIEQLFEIAGYKQIWDMHRQLIQMGQRVCLVNINDPVEGITQIFKFLNIPMKPEYLVWEACDTPEKVNQKIIDWHEYMNVETFLHWHGEALLSTGVSRPNTLESSSVVDFAYLPSEIRKIYAECYQHCIAYYELLLEKSGSH